MKHTILLFSSVFSVSLVQAQESKYWVGDTSKISLVYDSMKTPVPDTVAYVKEYSEGVQCVYWDKEFKHLLSRHSVRTHDTTWYNNGQVDMITDLVGNTDDDNYSIKGFYRDGKKKAETSFNGNQSTRTCYYHDGKVKAVVIGIKGYMPSEPGYYQPVYCEEKCGNGNTIMRDSLAARHVRKVVMYYCDGNKSKECYKYADALAGKYTEWYDNNQLKVSGQYNEISQEDIQKHRRPKKQGTWTYYDEKGKVQKEETYKDNVLVDAKK